MFVRKILHVLQDSDLSQYVVWETWAMQKYEKKIWTHEGPRRKKYRDTWRSQGIEKKDEHIKAHKKKKKEMIAMSQNKS